MFDPQTFLIFYAGAFLLNIAPGPDMAFTLATSARGGAPAGFAAAAGIGAGSLVWAALTAAGLATLLAASEHALMLIRMAGGAYLLYLAVKTFRHRHAKAEATGAASTMKAFRAGAVTNLLNPKVGLFFLAFLPTFIDPKMGSAALQVFLLGAIFSINGALILAVLALAAGAMRQRLMQSRKLSSWLNGASASVFAGLGLHLIFSRNP